jgi:cyclopropane-fatty-acyl-phospholipid synthase
MPLADSMPWLPLPGTIERDHCITAMNKDIVSDLSRHDIHCYGSDELLKFEANMTRYFEREYQRWRGNANQPESYGISSFSGGMVDERSYNNSLDPYNKDLNIYRAFLDKEYMAYSMAYYFADNEMPQSSQKEITLEQAQTEKFRLIAQRADIKDGHNILDLGCGFGGFVKYLQKNFSDITVTGINPSTTQSRYILNEAEIDHSHFRLIDRHLGNITNDALASNSFDRIISIGVSEHFNNLDLLFQQLKSLLKPGGKTFHHFIVSRDTIPQLLTAKNTLINEYFPGGHIWPYAEAQRHDRHLELVNSWFVNGRNYWKTLDEWHKRFWESIDVLYPAYISIEEVDRWNKYFGLSKAMFYPDEGNSYGNGHYLYQKL